MNLRAAIALFDLGLAVVDGTCDTVSVTFERHGILDLTSHIKCTGDHHIHYTDWSVVLPIRAFSR